MKRLFALLLLIATVLVADAAVQHGYVKTRGRMAPDGTLIPGRRLEGVTVQPRGRQPVVSAADGSFSFPVTAAEYSIMKVSKRGYRPVDQDITTRRYPFAPGVPLVIVMEEEQAVSADRLEAERRIRRALNDQIAAREDEIAALRESNRITAEEYETRLAELYARQARNETLIADMAARYAATDYDSIDDARRHINALILAGELDRADSIINSRGTMSSRIVELQRQLEAVASKGRIVSDATGLSNAVRDDLAADLYARHEIFMLRSEPDSALECLRIRASLDTLSPQWIYDYGALLEVYQRDVAEADSLLQRVVALATDPALEASALIRLGTLNRSVNRQAEAYKYTALALKRIEETPTERHRLPQTRAVMAEVMLDVDSVSNAIEQCRAAIADDPEPDTRASLYALLARALLAGGDTIGAVEAVSRAVEIPVENPALKADITVVQGIVDNAAGDYASGADRFRDAVDAYTDLYGFRHTRVADAYCLLASSLYFLGEVRTALAVRLSAFDIYETIYGTVDERLIDLYTTLAANYMRILDGDGAVDAASRALEIYLATSNPRKTYNRHGQLLFTLGNALSAAAAGEAALLRYDEAIEAICHWRDHDRDLMIDLWMAKGDTFISLGRRHEALEAYKRAHTVCVETYGDDNARSRHIYNNVIRPLRKDINNEWTKKVRTNTSLL